jgi:hypothetical protein
MEHALRTLELLPMFETPDNAADRALFNMEGELLTTPIAARSSSFTLTPRDLDIIFDVGIRKYLSIFQLAPPVVNGQFFFL